MKYNCDYKNFKVREEKNGTFSMLNKQSGKIMFLNKIASFVFNNPEIDNTSDLAEKIHEKYKDTDRSIIEKDCVELLYKMNALDIVDIITDEGQSNAKNNYITVAGEEDYKKISNFITKNISNPKMMIFCTSLDSRYYSTYAIRCRQFNNQEFYFIAFDNEGRISAVLSMGCGLSNTIYTLTSVFTNKENVKTVKEMLNYVFDLTKDLTKIRIMLKDDTSTAIKEYVLNLGFELEATLKKEYGNNDLYCYSLFREEQLK